MSDKSARINEIRFLELCLRIANHRNSYDDVDTFLEFFSNFLGIDPKPILELAREIEEPRFTPDKRELAVVMHERGYTRTKIAKLLNMPESTAGYNAMRASLVWYPRCMHVQQKALEAFMKGYDTVIAEDLVDIV